MKIYKSLTKELKSIGLELLKKYGYWSDEIYNLSNQINNCTTKDKFHIFLKQNLNN